jgi:hypothetical protein
MAKIKWLPFLARGIGEIFNRVPIEKMMVKERDTSADREELKTILETVPESQPEERPPVRHTATPGLLEPRKTAPQGQSRRVYEPTPVSGVSNEETLSYQKREVAKLLLRMERHYAQRMRIGGVACDCGASKHLLDMEAMAEEAIPITDYPDIFYRIVEWVGRVGPISSDQAARSGAYDDVYPHLSHEARDLRKELMGTLDPHALWPNVRVQIEDILKKYDQEDAARQQEPEAGNAEETMP